MRIFSVFFLISLSTVLIGQTIPNGDFDEWQIRDHYKLKYWLSPTANVQRTEDAKVGNYAIKLINTYSATSNGRTGYVRNIDVNRKDTLNGFPFNGDPLSLVFWSKHDLAPGDTARAYVIFRELGAFRGSVDFRLRKNQWPVFH